MRRRLLSLLAARNEEAPFLMNSRLEAPPRKLKLKLVGSVVLANLRLSILKDIGLQSMRNESWVNVIVV